MRVKDASVRPLGREFGNPWAPLEAARRPNRPGAPDLLEAQARQQMQLARTPTPAECVLAQKALACGALSSSVQIKGGGFSLPKIKTRALRC